MDIRHLKMVQTVAREGNLTRAGEKLFLSQSALSHQLKDMESQLGAPVFHRINKKLVLTSVGKMVLKSANNVLSEIEKTERKVKQIVQGDTGTIRIATECYTCYHWLPSIMKRFHQEFPNVELKIFPESTTDPVKELYKGKIDIGISSTLTDDSNLQYKKLFSDEMVAVVSNDHPWVGKSYVTAKDFANEDVIIHSMPLESVTLFSKLLIPKGIQPQKIYTMVLTEASLEMVKAGLGVKVMAKWAAKSYLDSEQVVAIPVTKRGLQRTWYAIMLMDFDLPLYMHLFVEYLAEEIKI